MSTSLRGMTRGAVISDCTRYRYRLWRTWDLARDTVTFVMLNPSTADAFEDDSTVRRCVGYAAEWGYGQLMIVNLFAYRATDPDELRGAPDPVGPFNDHALWYATRDAKQVVCAWGAHPFARERATAVLARLRQAGVQPYALRVTQEGAPQHPLYLPGTLKPTPYPPRGK